MDHVKASVSLARAQSIPSWREVVSSRMHSLQMSRLCLKSSQPNNYHQKCRFLSQITSTSFWRGIARKSIGNTSQVWMLESPCPKMRFPTPPTSWNPWGKSYSWSWISRETSSSGARSIILTTRGTRMSTSMSPRQKSQAALLDRMV